MTRIPQNDLKAGYLANKAEIDAAVARVLESGWYILGQEVAGFEREFAAYVGATDAIGVASGTDAIVVALRAAGVGPGDSVLTVSHTAVATVAAIELAGAIPVFVDIEPDTYTMDPADLKPAITSAKKPKAVIPVHIYGHPADMTAIINVAVPHGLTIIEDCAQAHGANFQGRQVGTIGALAAYSFYPTKNLGALGDGGAVVVSDPRLAERVRLLREYGWKERYVSAISGTNSRLDEIQAAILRAKLPHLDKANLRRGEIACLYHRVLFGTGLRLPAVRPGATHVYHQYVVRTPRRDDLRAYLKEQGIGTLIHYPVPVHQQPAYSKYATRPLPNTERAASEILSLPLYPEMPDADIEAVGDAIQSWAGARP